MTEPPATKCPICNHYGDDHDEWIHRAYPTWVTLTACPICGTDSPRDLCATCTQHIADLRQHYDNT